MKREISFDTLIKYWFLVPVIASVAGLSFLNETAASHIAFELVALYRTPLLAILAFLGFPAMYLLLFFKSAYAQNRTAAAIFLILALLLVILIQSPIH